MYVIRLNRLTALLAVIITVTVIGFTAHKAVQTYSPGKEAVRVPILMYHSILKNSDGNQYTVSPSGFENDLIFLQNHGYTTVLMQDLIDYAYNGADLPKKPIVLTFDDGFYNNYVYVYPLLEKYHSKAVISVVGTYTDTYTENGDTNPGYAYLPWSVLLEMAGSGAVEIQNHTYGLHSLDKGRKGSKKNPGETSEEYALMLKNDLDLLQKKCIEYLGSAPTTFTYPFGFVSNESFDVVKSLGFKASLSCEEGTNELDRDPEQLYMLKRCIRTPSRSAEDILSE